MTVENKITPISIDGKERVVGDERYLVVQSAFASTRVVHLRWGKLDLEISADELHAANLITDEEYAWLCMEAPLAKGGGSPSPRRLEDYDDIRAKLTTLQSDANRYRHAIDQIGFRFTATGVEQERHLSERCVAVLRGEPFNALYDPRRTY